MSASQLRSNKWNASQLKEAGFDPGELLDSGFAIYDVVSAGFSPESLRIAGLNDSAKEFQNNKQSVIVANWNISFKIFNSMKYWLTKEN